MGLIDSLRGNKVGLDTAPFIYFIEENAAYLSIVDPLFKAIDGGEIIAVTSIMSLIETLVLPIRTSDEALARKYRDILLSNDKQLPSLTNLKTLMLNDLRT